MLKHVLSLFLVLSTTQFGNSEEIPEDAISGWIEMAKAVETVQAELRSVDVSTGDIREYWCARQGELSKCEYISLETKKPERVDIINEKGCVIALVDGKWQLREVLDAKEMVRLDNFMTVLEGGFRLHGLTKLQEIKNNPNFEVVEWREATAEKNWVDFVVRCRDPELTARISLDPSKRFRVREVVYEESQPPPAHYIYEYQDDSLLGEVIPVRVHLKGESEGWSVSEVSDRALPYSEFSIEYYGLPQFVTGKGTNWWLWIFFASVCVMIVLVIYRGRSN